MTLLKTKNPASQPTTTYSYLHHDHLQSTRLITDDQGNKVEELDYFPYGSSRHPEDPAMAGDEGSSSGMTDIKYTSQIKDFSTNLYYYHARYYNPQTAHFISADKAEGPNRYSYVAGNPIVRNDPSGSQEEEPLGENTVTLQLATSDRREYTWGYLWGRTDMLYEGVVLGQGFDELLTTAKLREYLLKRDEFENLSAFNLFFHLSYPNEFYTSQYIESLIARAKNEGVNFEDEILTYQYIAENMSNDISYIAYDPKDTPLGNLGTRLHNSTGFVCADYATLALLSLREIYPEDTFRYAMISLSGSQAGSGHAIIEAESPDTGEITAFIDPTAGIATETPDQFMKEYIKGQNRWWWLGARPSFYRFYDLYSFVIPPKDKE